MWIGGLSGDQPIIHQSYNIASKGPRMEVLGSEIGNWEGIMEYAHMVEENLPVLEENTEMASILPQIRAPYSAPSLLMGM